MENNDMKQTETALNDYETGKSSRSPLPGDPQAGFSGEQQSAASPDIDDIFNEGHGTDIAPCPACSSRHKLRSDDDKKALLTRLRKIEGQIRGLEKMVENNAYCPDILIQVSAANNALNSFSRVLLNSHIHSCVAEDIRDGNDETIDELCSLLQKLMK